MEITTIDTRPAPTTSTSPRPHTVVSPTTSPLTTVAGYPVWIGDVGVTIALDGYEVSVAYLPNSAGAAVRAVPMDDLVRIAESLRPVPAWTDRGTWNPATAQPALQRVH